MTRDAPADGADNSRMIGNVTVNTAFDHALDAASCASRAGQRKERNRQRDGRKLCCSHSVTGKVVEERGSYRIGTEEKSRIVIRPFPPANPGTTVQGFSQDYRLCNPEESLYRYFAIVDRSCAQPDVMFLRRPSGDWA